MRLPIAGQGFVPNRGQLPEDFPYEKNHVVWIDVARKMVLFAPGIEIPARPFWGVMGVAPPASMGRVPSGPPGVFGGNLDNPDLGAGSTLYLPVNVPGALLSIGDGHAVQGHGEVSLSAVETSLKGEVQVVLHKQQHLRWPRAETATHYITMGLHTDLDEAAKIATREMLDWLVQTKGLSRDDAYLLASAAMDLYVTQVVDGTKGVPRDVAKGDLPETGEAVERGPTSDRRVRWGPHSLCALLARHSAGAVRCTFRSGLYRPEVETPRHAARPDETIEAV